MTSRSGVASCHELQVSSGKSEFMTSLSKRCNSLVSQHLRPQLGKRVAQRSAGDLYQPVERMVQLFDQKDRPETDSAAANKVTKTMELLAVAHRGRRI